MEEAWKVLGEVDMAVRSGDEDVDSWFDETIKDMSRSYMASPIIKLTSPARLNQMVTMHIRCLSYCFFCDHAIFNDLVRLFIEITPFL